MRTFKFYSLSKLQFYSTVLLVVVIFYVRSLDLVDLIAESLYTFACLSLFPLAPGDLFTLFL